jgi:alpha-galactosidase
MPSRCPNRCGDEYPVEPKVAATAAEDILRSIQLICVAAVTCATLAVVPGGPALAQTPKFLDWAPTPPMGWNSWDCFGAGVTEHDAMANADYMDQHLKSHGWNIITIDIQWYEPQAHTDQYRKGAVLEMDSNGRLLPAGNRFPLTKETHSFKAIGDALHAKGLKFGLHLMRGIPRQAVDQNVPILGTSFHAADIADKNSTCAWNTDMYGVDMTKPGAQEYYNSVFALMASWGLDLVKVDDLSRPYHKAEIAAIRHAIDQCGRPIIFSTSPGATPLDEGPDIETKANMWRISDDFWDDWGKLMHQVDLTAKWQPYMGAGHYPDADMLPLGVIRQGQGKTHFTPDEQVTLMTLWCIVRSPLIFGGDLMKMDAATLALITNDEVIDVDQNSRGNMQLFHRDGQMAWVANVPGSTDKYLAVFNLQDKGSSTASGASVPVKLNDLGFNGSCKVHDLWLKKDLDLARDTFAPVLPWHGAGLYRIK